MGPDGQWPAPVPALARHVSTQATIALAGIAASLSAAESTNIERRDLYDVRSNDKVEFRIQVGPNGLFGFILECSLDGLEADVTLYANDSGRHYPLWSDDYRETVDIEYASNGATYKENNADPIGDSWVESDDPHEVLDFLATAGSTLRVTITNQEDIRHVETFRSSSWRGLAALCGYGPDDAPVFPIGRDRVLIDDVEAAVDRYRNAAP